MWPEVCIFYQLLMIDRFGAFRDEMLKGKMEVLEE
jgi:hypothetical protein